MSTLPFALFKIVQGLSYPNKSRLLIVGKWDISDWEASHLFSSNLDSSTDIVVINDSDENLDLYLKKFNNIDYRFHLIIHSRTSNNLEKYLTEKESSSIIDSNSGATCVLLNKYGGKSFLSDKIKSNEQIKIEDRLYFLPHFDPENWSQTDTTVTFKAPETKIMFTVPNTFSLQRTSPDLLWAVECLSLIHI